MYSRLFCLVSLILFCTTATPQANRVIQFSDFQKARFGITGVTSTGTVLRFQQPVTSTNLLNLAKRSLSVKTPLGLTINALLLASGLYYFGNEFYDRNQMISPNQLDSVFCEDSFVGSYQQFVPASWLQSPFVSTDMKLRCKPTAIPSTFFDDVEAIVKARYIAVSNAQGCMMPEVTTSRKVTGFGSLTRYRNRNVSNPTYSNVEQLSHIGLGNYEITVTHQFGATCIDTSSVVGGNYSHITNDLTRSGSPFSVPTTAPKPLTADMFRDLMGQNAVQPLIQDDFNRWLAGLPSVLPWGEILKGLCGGVVCTPATLISGINDGALNPNYSADNDLLRQKESKEPTDEDVSNRLLSEYPAPANGVTLENDFDSSPLSVSNRVVSCPVNVWEYTFTFFKGMTKTISVKAKPICDIAPVLNVFIIFVFSVLGLTFAVKHL